MKIKIAELEFKTPFNLVVTRTQKCGVSALSLTLLSTADLLQSC